jgi:hypothetical protein
LSDISLAHWHPVSVVQKRNPPQELRVIVLVHDRRLLALALEPVDKSWHHRGWAAQGAMLDGKFTYPQRVPRR